MSDTPPIDPTTPLLPRWERLADGTLRAWNAAGGVGLAILPGPDQEQQARELDYWHLQRVQSAAPEQLRLL